MEERLLKLYEKENLCDECTQVLSISRSFTPEWRAQRKDIMKNGPETLNMGVALSEDRQSMTFGGEDIPTNSTAAGMSLFLTACMTADFVWVDELIMLGANSNQVSESGETAVFLCCSALLFTSAAKGRFQPETPIPGHLKRKAMLRCSERILRRLLDIGVDPLLAPHAGQFAGYTPLHILCGLGLMGLSRILLEFGADISALAGPDQERPEEFVPEQQIGVFKAILRRVKKQKKKKAANQTHQPLCWCLNGKKLCECHGEETGGQPVEGTAYCPCGSGKRYRRCCLKKGVVYKETRDKYSEVTTIKSPLAVKTMCDFLKAREEQKGGKLGPNDYVFGDDPAEVLESHMKFKANMIEQLVSLGFVAEPFAYAFKKVDFIPRVVNIPMAKNEAIKRMNEWNEAVDEYIESGVDSRSKYEIEVLSKIGSHQGPLYQRCNNIQSCKNVEPEDGSKFQTCSRCKKVVYCSLDCQRAHWKSGHKHNCGKDMPIPLVSQESLERFMEGAQDFDPFLLRNSLEKKC